MTIKERAYQKALKMMRVNPMARPTTRELLVEMAIEQRKIDIDKACEWLKTHVGSAYIDMGKVGLSECHCQDWWLDDFCKAMEEE